MRLIGAGWLGVGSGTGPAADVHHTPALSPMFLLRSRLCHGGTHTHTSLVLLCVGRRPSSRG